MKSDSPYAVLSASRRSFFQFGGAASAALASGILSESFFALSARAASLPHGPFPKDAVIIDANENPLGPCSVAREAISEITANSGRYQYWLTEDLTKQFAQQEGLKPEYVRAFPGSGEPLHFTVLAFTSAARSYVTADPGYEAGMHAAKISGARVVKTPLTATFAHDAKAMVAAAPDAGLFYVCTPNNPTGTLTPHSDIEYLVEHKPKGSIVLVDEAYIHFSDATTATDLVKADKDIVVLRTFSKIYGMAGLRCGLAIGRPDLLERISSFSGWNSLPVTAVAAAIASLGDPALVPERKKINASARGETFAWLERNGYSYTPSASNCFMLDTKRPTKEIIDAMAARNVFIGRAWPIWPTHVRITVGTKAEMEKFQAAFKEVMQAKPARIVTPPSRDLWATLDGPRVPLKLAPDT
ncbi:MAG TPA: pyridoxal phosphate-dependent aminotransferase [Candidatus Eisenbacteria bacterium]|nr:pyridoxal phosphate-dependent aminotransferase [Candidatus Eisenbacteria bacterium]